MSQLRREIASVLERSEIAKSVESSSVQNRGRLYMSPMLPAKFLSRPYLPPPADLIHWIFNLLVVRFSRVFAGVVFGADPGEGTAVWLTLSVTVVSLASSVQGGFVVSGPNLVPNA